MGCLCEVLGSYWLQTKIRAETWGACAGSYLMLAIDRDPSHLWCTAYAGTAHFSPLCCSDADSGSSPFVPYSCSLPSAFASVLLWSHTVDQVGPTWTLGEYQGVSWVEGHHQSSGFLLMCCLNNGQQWLPQFHPGSPLRLGYLCVHNLIFSLVMAALDPGTTLTWSKRSCSVHLAQAGMCAEVVVGNLAATKSNPLSTLLALSHGQVSACTPQKQNLGFIQPSC